MAEHGAGVPRVSRLSGCDSWCSAQTTLEHVSRPQAHANGNNAATVPRANVTRTIVTGNDGQALLDASVVAFLRFSLGACLDFATDLRTDRRTDRQTHTRQQL